MIEIEPHPSRKNKLLINKDGEFWKEMNKSLVVKVMQGQATVPLDEYLEEEKKVCSSSAAEMLLKKMQTSHMLRAGLIKKGFEKQSIDHALSVLFKYGYLNDSKRAEAYVEKLLEKGFGPQYILMKMVHYLGFPKEEAEQYLSMFCDRHKVEDALKRIISQSHEMERRKIVDKLLKKGFTYDSLSHIRVED